MIYLLGNIKFSGLAQSVKSGNAKPRVGDSNHNTRLRSQSCTSKRWFYRQSIFRAISFVSCKQHVTILSSVMSNEDLKKE